MSAIRQQIHRWSGRGGRRGRARGVALGVVLAGILASGPAAGATIETILEPFTGGPASVRITLSDEAEGLDEGEILVTAVALEGGAIRGVFFNLAHDGALHRLQADGEHVTDLDASGNVINLRHGVNLYGGGSPCPCDFAVEIGSPGRSRDFIRSTEFVLSNEEDLLDISLFSGQNVGVRLSPVSSKLGGVFAVPEASTSLLLASSLVALIARRRCRRSAS